MTRKLNVWLLALLLMTGIPYYWFLLDDGPADVRPHAVTIAQLRALASSIPGQRPISVQVETIGTRALPGNLLAAGAGLKRLPTAVRAYALTRSDAGPVLIDAGTSPEMAALHDVEAFDSDAQARIRQAQARASLQVLLVDKALHNGGLATDDKERRALAEAIGTRPRALAPGVVGVPLTGLTPHPSASS